MVLISCGSATDRILEETSEQFYEIEPTASVSIKNIDGTIRIYGSSSNQMRVEAIKRAYTRKRLKQIAVNVSVEPDSVSIETSSPPKQAWGLFDRSGTVDYTIVVPQTAKLSRVELTNGEVSVDEMRGQSVQARLASGRMLNHNCFSNVDFIVGRGTLTFAYEWWEAGKFFIRAHIARGNGLIFMPSDAAFHLLAETTHGKIGNDFAEQRDRGDEEVTRVNTLIRGGGEATIKMHARQGNIKIVEQNP
jgi:hypothetical protein